MQHSNARYAACERICSGRSQLLPSGNMAQQRLQFLSLHCLMRPLRPEAAPHLKRDLSYDADFPNLVFQHPIGFHHILAEHLRNGFNTTRWDSEFEPVSWARLPTVRQQMMRRGQILWQQPKLDQDSRSIPCNVFMIQTISANADDRGEGNPQFSTRGRNSRSIRH